MLDALSECVRAGDDEQIKKMLPRCLEAHSLSEVVKALDRGIDLLAREWHANYDWNGQSKDPNPPISYREFQKAWDAYEVAHAYILSKEAMLLSSKTDLRIRQVKIGTGTLGNVHKAILRIDLHLRLFGWTVEFLGYELSPQDIFAHEKDIDAFVLSVMAHSAQVPALRMLKEVTNRCRKPIFVGGSALKAIDAWLKHETSHVPYFVKEHGIHARDFRDVSDFTRHFFDGAIFVGSLDDLQQQLLATLASKTR